jgi:uncharacterized membrane protein
VKQQTRIKIELTANDKIVEIIGWFALAAIWAMVITSYPKLPNTIPTHYNAVGEVDGLGNRINIFLLPLLATLFFVGITILNKFPHIFNYLNQIDSDNALRHYTNATRMNRYIKLFFIVVFGMLAFKTIHVSGKPDSWFLPLTLGFFFISTIYFIIKLFSTKVDKQKRFGQ